MYARLIIPLTMAFVMILNAHIAMAQPLTTSEQMLLDVESAQLAKKLAFHLQHSVEVKYQPYVKENGQTLPPLGYIENYENNVDNINDVNNNVNESGKSVEEVPEPLPNAEKLVADDKTIMYKKHGRNYHMTICHFKICNMGRKRDTHNQLY